MTASILLPSRCRTSPSPSLPPRKRRGTIIDAHTVNFVDRNAPNSGPTELCNLTHGNFGGQLTFYSVVVACQLILPSMLNRLTVSLLRRSLRCSAAPAARLHRYFVVTFRAFSPLATDYVINAVRRLPDKFSAADSIPPSIFKQIIDVIAPFVVALFNRPFFCRIQGVVSHVYREDTGARHHRRSFVSTDFEPDGAVEAT